MNNGMTNLIFAIDPGDVQSAYCIVDTATYKPLEFGKVGNYELRAILADKLKHAFARAKELTFDGKSLRCDEFTVVIERIASYGMAVGATVFTTCEWIGRFAEITEQNGSTPQYVFRKEEKLTICGDSRAKDANIRRALIDRFAQHDMKNGRGTKANPDWFYGFYADCWSAYAVAYCYIEKIKEHERKMQHETTEF